MKNRLLSLAQEQPKHWQFAVKRDTALLTWINQQTADLPADTPFMLRAYCAASGERPACARGNARKLKSFGAGFGFCGKTGVCACAKESVSTNVAKTKANDTPEQRAAIQAKREETNLARYGHRNSGQSDKALEAHKAFYSDKANVVAVNAKVRQTMLDTYGVPNGFNTEKANLARSIPLSSDSRARGAAKRAAHAQAGGLLAKSYEKLVARLEAIGFTMTTSLTEYSGLYGHTYYDFVCHRCSLPFRDYLFASHDPTCPLCDQPQPFYVSKEEVQVREFIESLTPGPIVYNSKKHIKNGELDIFLPNHKLAIEYCGLYWHSEVNKPDKLYHQRKLEVCQEQGIRLLTIFSDEWLTKQDICKSRLRHILGRAETRLHGRQTCVRAIEPQVSREFLERHHLQGAAPGASLHFGLYHQGVLVAVMTFGKPRLFNGRNQRALWELYRFATSVSVTGGAGKLFSHFVNAVQPDDVVSYCDLRWGDGKVYTALGFVLDSVSRPSYSYVENYQVRHHRYRFAKHVLVEQGFDPNKSEAEIMRERRFDRIWDCGSAKYLWHSVTNK